MLSCQGSDTTGSTWRRRKPPTQLTHARSQLLQNFLRTCGSGSARSDKRTYSQDKGEEMRDNTGWIYFELKASMNASIRALRLMIEVDLRPARR